MIQRELELPDCGDNSCLFSGGKGGMRTNGGCRCFLNAGFDSAATSSARKMLPELLLLRRILAEHAPTEQPAASAPVVLICPNCKSDVLIEDLEFPNEPITYCDNCKDWPATPTRPEQPAASAPTSGENWAVGLAAGLARGEFDSDDVAIAADFKLAIASAAAFRAGKRAGLEEAEEYVGVVYKAGWILSNPMLPSEYKTGVEAACEAIILKTRAAIEKLDAEKE